MPTAVSICSNALLMLGAQPINAMDEDSDRARLASNLYPDVRDMVLRSHPWNCCIKRVVLSPDAQPPAFGFAQRYVLPGDFLRLLDIDGDTEYQIEGREILSDRSLLKLRYIYRNEIEATWDALLIHAVTVSMRQAMAYPTTMSTSLEQLITQVLQPILAQARAVDGQENPPETLGDERLYMAGF